MHNTFLPYLLLVLSIGTFMISGFSLFGISPNRHAAALFLVDLEPKLEALLKSVLHLKTAKRHR